MLRTAATIALATLLLTTGAALAKPAAKPAAAAKKPAAQATRPGVIRRGPAGGGAAGNAALTAAFNSYCDGLRGKLDKGWYVPDGKNKVSLTADVDKDGTVTNLNVSSSPSNTAAEQAASDAFNSAQPLSALPAGAQSIKLNLTFDSFADPHGDTNRNITTKIDNIVLPGQTPPANAAPATTSGGGGN